MSAVLILVYKLDVNDNIQLLAIAKDRVFLPRLIYGILGGTIVIAKLSSVRNSNLSFIIPGSITLLLILLSRPHNAPLFLLLALMVILLRSLTSDTLVFSYLLMAQSSFYSFGNSNSIANIDLSNSYVGLDDFSMEWSGLLTSVSTFAGPIAVFVMFTLLTPLRPAQILSEWLFFRCISILNLSVAVTILRHHLFIWTVFSPKYLYELAWLAGYTLLLVPLSFLTVDPGRLSFLIQN